MIGLPVPVEVRQTPPLVDEQFAEYFGVVSELPFACAAVSNGNDTLSPPTATLAVVGLATRAGAPTMSAGDAADATLVPAAFVAVTVQV